MRIVQNTDLQNTSALSHNDREWVYNALDCCVTMEVFESLEPLLTNTTASTYAFSLDLQGPVLDMSMRGLLVDDKNRQEVLAQYKTQIKQLSDALTRILVEGVGLPPTFNWRSPVQLKNLFYNIMGLKPIRKRNAQGKMAPTVNREALEKLSVYFIAQPICGHLLALRDLDKKRGFLETSIDSDGRMRCNFNIGGTNTGRLASSMSDFGTGGNLQNVDRDLRYTFVADPGYVYVNLDGEQADARNVGALCWNLFLDSKGPEYAGAYLDACESGDLHTQVCRMAWQNLEWPNENEFTDAKSLAKAQRLVADVIAYRQDSYRQLAKKLGHGTNYYGQPRTMAMHTKVETALIEDFQFRYFRAFPAIQKYHEWVRQQLQDWGYIITPFGRRRTFFGRSNEDTTLREAIAYSPQSMTADEIDLGMLQMWRKAKYWDAQLLVQVHDSALWQVPLEAVNEFVPWALKTKRVDLMLEGGRQFTVPIEAKVGFNWGDYNDDPKKGRVNLDGLDKWQGKFTKDRLFDYVPKAKFTLNEYL